MKSQTRAWIVFGLLFVFWGTLASGPFSYFAGMVRQLADFLFSHRMFSPGLQAGLIYFFIAVLLTGLLLLSRHRSRIYIAGFCALAGMIHHLILCLRTRQIYEVSLPIAIGLALALLFLLIKPQSPALWLSDAFIISLPVYLLYDGLLSPLFSLLELDRQSFEPLMLIPADSLVFRMQGFLNLPQWTWAILPVVLALAPMIWLTPGRKKG